MKTITESSNQHTSELGRVVTAEVFEKAYLSFIEQADKNAISKKSNGSKTPFGFYNSPFCNGAHFSLHYGHGAASATPYINWWVVSVYYLPQSGKIALGIEEGRYAHINEISVKPLNYQKLGNKNILTAVYYETTKSTVNYQELYDKFITICEEVMRLGLE